MFEYKNFSQILRDYFLEIKNNPELSDSSFYDDTPYVLLGTFLDWYIKKNKIFFFYKKEVFKIFLFVNKCFESGDDKIKELIFIESFPFLYANFSERKIMNSLKGEAKEEYLKYLHNRYF